MSASPESSSTSTHYCRSQDRHLQDRRGFTLTELLIVITLIVIILGIAIPTLSTLTGSRSTESGKNQLAAMLGRARGFAIQSPLGTAIGVAIYVDPVNGRTDMALVRMINSVGASAYQAWIYQDGIHLLKPDGTVDTTTAVQYQTGDVVFRLGDASTWTSTNPNFQKDPLEVFPGTNATKKTVKTFVCSQSHIAATGKEPGTSGGDNFWNWIPPSSLDLYQGEVEQLPKGVAVELINDSASTNTNGTDQYVHTGVILFDSTGKLLVTPVVFVPGTSLFNSMASPSWPGIQKYIPAVPTSANSTQLIYSNVGVAIYDSTAIVDQPFYTSNTATTAADINLPMTSIQLPNVPSQTVKTQQDTWISNNAQLFFVSRSSGTLLKAE
jgi:prepilin-type N-terminal cleavage/methylation domain-containing protein